MADHHGRRDSPGLPQPRQRIFDREQRGLAPCRLGQLAGRVVDDFQQAAPQYGDQKAGTLIQLSPKLRLGSIEATQHPRVLTPLPRKQEGDGRIPHCTGLPRAERVRGLQPSHRFSGARCKYVATIRKWLPANLQSMSYVGQVALRIPM